ncbi:integrator complex subunit 15 isoform X1 [Danaus plexippus]|uniref:integrator complex subunit 15 isoform X1 n=1 Tax=Danaus plexippus TaxID=13037 RepID=UPI002AB1C707|nr:integrator complex subunit 15 isoform X1 [Danaus plexippus]XP_061378160.1 integrator complex subunit 15 isoform X1 [Danaus plexippus]
MSASDLKHTLRKFEFPACAKEALIKIEQLLVGRAAPTSKQLDIAMDIISEFVFCETDRRSNPRRGLNPLQELQLIDIICDYLCACTNDTTKNTIFLSLFGGKESQRKLKILSILASMAVSASSTPVLLAVGVWLQQMGCSSSQSLQLAENIVRDHFYLNTSNQNVLKTLATDAPQFVSNFITAVTELYLHDIQKPKKMPPKNLLEVITSWVYTNPSLCMSAQLNPAALPIGSIPMAAVTPLAGLIHWCALAPLYVDEDFIPDIDTDPIPIKKIKLEEEKHTIVKSVTSKSLSETELYIKLHLGVLHSLRAGKRTHGPPTAVNAQHLVALTPIVQAYAHNLIKCGVKFQSDNRLQDCLDRIGQAVQVALANGCVYGNINNLLAALNSLPENRLLCIIIKSHHQSI